MKLINKFVKRFNINTQPIIMVLFGLIFMSVILAATIIASAQNRNSQNGAGNINENNLSLTAAPIVDGSVLAVVEDINTDKQMITLFDVNQRIPLSLSYTGGTNITDKYGQIISMSQIALGDMVDATYEEKSDELTSMNLSTRAWEYDDVSNMSIYTKDHIMKIASTKYKFNNDLYILNGKDAVTVDTLTEQDVLKVWGYQETIWSVTVSKGHGIVKLEDYKDYLGDSVTIGYESMLQITNNLAVPVREGTYNLTVENGLYNATKSVTVKRNKVTYVSLKDMGPVGLKKSEVTFQITPDGADLYVDGILTPYSDPVELSYGNHTAIATLSGYTAYKGTISVDSETETIKINLPEDKSNKDASATQSSSDSDSTSDSSTASTDSNSSSSDSSTSDTSDTSNSNSSDDTKYSKGSTDYKLADGDSVDKDHKIYIKAPSGASVYLDSEYMGTAPVKFDKIIGSHVLTFIKDGYKTTSYSVEVADDDKDEYYTFPKLTKKK